MKVRSIKQFLFLFVTLLFVLAVCGCGGEDVSDDKNGRETMPGETERDNGNGTDIDISALWAPPVDFDFAAEYGSPGANERFIASLPLKGDVSFPAYPGARALTNNEPQGQHLANIWLLTTDSMEKVFNFYRERLEGWQFEEKPGIGYELWKDGEKMDVYGYLAPGVLIRNPVDTELEYMPGAQTAFIVVYTSN